MKQGFPPCFGAGVITTSSALGILIRPSIAMVMYSVATNTSVGQLFIARVISGFMRATLLGLTTWYRARKIGCPRLPKASFAQRMHALRESFWGLSLIVLIFAPFCFWWPSHWASIRCTSAS